MNIVEERSEHLYSGFILFIAFLKWKLIASDNGLSRSQSLSHVLQFSNILETATVNIALKVLQCYVLNLNSSHLIIKCVTPI